MNWEQPHFPGHDVTRAYCNKKEHLFSNKEKFNYLHVFTITGIRITTKAYFRLWYS